MAKDPMDVISAEFSRWAAAPGRELSGEPVTDAAEADLLLGLNPDHSNRVVNCHLRNSSARRLR